MQLALRLGRRGRGAVWPNPAVGCIIVQGARVVGRGWTQVGGRPHAESEALDQAGPGARGGTAYVTLEPCAHHGQTPPCADALIAAGVARVVVAIRDPDPRVAGTGVERLRAAGIDVNEGVEEVAAWAEHRGFLRRVRDGRPMVTLKLAASLDGRIATASGESRWITGKAARRVVHAHRAAHDAVLVGAGTVRADDPDLTVRGMGQVRQPVRVVASRHLDLPRDGRLEKTAREVPLWLLHGAGADSGPWRGVGARTIEVAAGDDQQLSPSAMLETLGREGLTRVFCEGGGALAASLLSAGLVDELVVFHAGVALGAEGTPGIGAFGIDRLADAPRFDHVETRVLGNDIMTRWTA